MSLTQSQQETLKTFVEADPVLSLKPATAQGAYEIAQELQAIASPAFTVWKSSVAQDEITQNGFAWAEVDSLTVGQARIWEWLFDNSSSTINPSKPNVRQGISDCWKGNAAKLAVGVAVLGHCKRSANIAEKLFATGTGSDASPATMSIEGSVSYNEVGQAMGWSF